MKTLFLLVALFLCLGSIHGAVIHVPSDFPKIQQAIQAAQHGDTVLVAPGTYFENINYHGKAITVSGSNGCLTTAIDGTGKGSVVTFFSGEGQDSILDGFTLFNGSGTDLPPFRFGGGIYCDHASPRVQNCIIRDNQPVDLGGGIFCFNASPSILNTAVVNNSASGYGYGVGGGLACWYQCAPTLASCTITGNTAEVKAGGIWCYRSVDLTVTNSVIWGNEAGSYAEMWIGGETYPSKLSISYSDLDDGQFCITPGSNLEWGPGMINQDPMLLDVEGKDCRLSSPSPCIDQGTNDAQLLNTDFIKEPRLVDGLDDGDLLVDMGCDEFMPLYVPRYYANIQKAIGAAVEDDLVIVAPGTYRQCIHYDGKAITVRSDTDQDPSTYDICAALTVLDGLKTDSVVNFSAGEDTDSVLDGFTLTNGEANAGGGIYCFDNSSPTIQNCIIHNNSALWGGGICCYKKSSPVILNCLFTCNAADGLMSRGGGIYCLTSSKPLISFCTVAGNEAAAHGGGLCCWDGGNAEITDCIIWNNTAPTGKGIYSFDSDPKVTYCDVEEGFPGTGNLSVDPLFFNPADCDYHLRQMPCEPGVNNPCVDAGSAKASVLGMDELWTRKDSVPDAETADMGYHYGLIFHDGALAADVHQLSGSSGGTVQFTLNAGAAHASRKYLVVGGLSGTSPGFPLPGGSMLVPVNWDFFTDTIVSLLNSSVFNHFAGLLDATGKGSAQFNMVPIPELAGHTMHFAFCLGWPWEYASNPVCIQVVP